MLFGNSTEPSYAGIRVPRLYSGDDAVLTRQVSPQERYRQYAGTARERLLPVVMDEQIPIKERYRQYNGASRTEAEQRRLDQVLDDKEEGYIDEDFSGTKAEKRKQQFKNTIQGMGSDIAALFARNDQRQPLSLPPVMMGEQIPIIDPRWLPRRENGGPVKKNRPYLVGEDGPEVIVPEDDGTVIPNGRRSVDWDLKEILAPQEETVTETVTEKPVETPEPSTADMLRGQVNDIQRRLAKGATKNPDGTTTYGDKQYRKRNALDVLKSAGLGVLQSLASAPPTNDLGALLGRAIGGGAAGGVMGATMNNADEKMQDRMKLAQILPQYQQAYGIERQKKADDDLERLRATQIRNYNEDNENARWGRNIQERALAQQEKNRVSREETSRMTAIAGILKNAPEFIPGDAKYKELQEALGDVKLPIFTKDAKKKVDLKQDQRTGAWTVILTNPVTGQQEVRPVMKNGKEFASTPTVVMQGEYGMLRQNDAQAFTQSENEKNRQLRVQLQQNAQQYGS